MVKLLTEKKPNGRQSLILILEPQELEHIKKGDPLTVDTSDVKGYDIFVSYVPDAERFKDLMAQELPLVNRQQFQRLLHSMQQYPEVYRRRPANVINDEDIKVRKQ